MKLSSAILSTLFITFTSLTSLAQLQNFSCDKAAADKALSELSAIDNYKGDLVLYKMANLNTIKAYLLSLESNLAKTDIEKTKLMTEALNTCSSEAP